MNEDKTDSQESPGEKSPSSVIIYNYIKGWISHHDCYEQLTALGWDKEKVELNMNAVRSINRDFI